MAVPTWAERAWILSSGNTAHPDYSDLRDVVDAGIELADENGSLSEVTLRALTERLDLEDSRVYDAVGSRLELHQLMWDRACTWSEEEYRIQDGDWRERMLCWVHSFRSVYEKHPWAILVPSDQASLIAPSFMRATDALAGILLPLGLDGAAITGISRSLATYVRGYATLAMPSQVESATGPLSAIASIGAMAEQMGLPHLAEMAQSTAPADLVVGAHGGSRGLIGTDGRIHPENTVKQLFDPGAELMIQGVADLIETSQ